MMRVLFGAAFGLALSAAAARPDRPVLLELFTSEGCSSCPPADALLERLDRTQPVPGAQLIVLSEHVDYWNHIGWTDPFSSRAFTLRQEDYARHFRSEGPYTPQLVVDGRHESVGSDARAAEAAIREELGKPQTAVRIETGGGSAEVQVDPLPPGTARKAEVYAAWADEEGTSEVARGENQGRRLHHVAIVKELKPIGAVYQHQGFRGELPLKPGMRLVVFVQEGAGGAVWGAAMAR